MKLPIHFKSCLYIALFYVSISYCTGQQDFSLKKKSPLYEIPALEHVKDVNAAIKDKRGFIWLSTYNGLYKYDGYETKHYTYDPTQPHKIAGNWINYLVEDDFGNIWFSVFGIGLQKLDPVTERFTLITADPSNPTKLPNNRCYISAYYNGEFWIITQGAESGKYSPKTNKFKRYNNITGWTDFINTNNSLWALNTMNNSGGIFKYDEILDSFLLKIPLNEDCIALLANNQKIYCNLNGIFSSYDIEKNVITRYDIAKKDKPLSASMTHNGKILIIRETNIEEFDPVTQTFDILTNEKRIKDFMFDSYKTNTLPLNQNKFFIASNKNFILEYDQKAIEKYELIQKDEKSDFHHSSLSPLPNNSIRFGQSIICNLKNEEISYPSINYPALKKFTEKKNDHLSFNTIEYIDNENIRWLVFFEKSESSTISFYKFNPVDGKLELLRKIDAVQKIRTIASVTKEADTIWLATWRSLVKFNVNTKQYTIIGEKKDSTGLCSGGLRCVFLDKDGDLWVGTQGGLNRKKKGTDYFIHYLSKPGDKNSLSFNTVSNILEDNNGLIWIGTFGGGLNAFDKKTNQFKWYTTQNGLPDNNIQSVEIQEDQSIWFSHDKGISHLNPRTGKVQNYSNNKINGVVESGEHASTTLEDGSLIFAGWGEFNRIRPHLLVADSSRTPMYLTDIKLFNKSLGINDADSILHQNISVTKSLTFKHNQNVITLKYAALDYTEAEHRQYAYKLEGFDKDWQYVGQKREVTFTNLSSGTYTFRVKSANRYDIWHEMEQPLSISILPPWWQTWWSYGFYILMLAWAAKKIHQHQKAKTIKKEREIARERELKQAKEIELAYRELGFAHENLKSTQAQLIQSEKMASLGELTAGIAHEIQNPLNFVNNFSEVSNELIDEIQEERAKNIENRDEELVNEILGDIKQNLEKITHHGQRADAIVKGMLAHSRSSKGEKELSNINALADEYLRLSYHGLRAKDKSFNATFETDFDSDLPKINVVTQDIGRVLLNLINNAFQAVHERSCKEEEDFKPEVIVSTKTRGDKVEISVKDNGLGIPDAIKDKIFQPFFTTKPTGQGTGLGLSLSYDIVKAHGGQIKLKSNKNEGTEFTIELPL